MATRQGAELLHRRLDFLLQLDKNMCILIQMERKAK